MTIFCIISQNGMILHAKMSTILTFKVVEENDLIFRGNDWIFRIWLNFSWKWLNFSCEMTDFFVWGEIFRRKIQPSDEKFSHTNFSSEKLSQIFVILGTATHIDSATVTTRDFPGTFKNTKMGQPWILTGPLTSEADELSTSNFL